MAANRDKGMAEECYGYVLFVKGFKAPAHSSPLLLRFGQARSGLAEKIVLNEIRLGRFQAPVIERFKHLVGWRSFPRWFEPPPTRRIRRIPTSPTERPCRHPLPILFRAVFIPWITRPRRPVRSVRAKS